MAIDVISGRLVKTTVPKSSMIPKNAKLSSAGTSVNRAMVKISSSIIRSRLMITVVLGLLLIPFASTTTTTTTPERVINENVTDVGITLCYSGRLPDYQQEEHRKVGELLDAIADEWPVRSDQMRIGFSEVKITYANAVVSILNISDGENKDTVKETKNILERTWKANHYNCCASQRILNESMSSHEAGLIGRKRAGVPILWVMVAVDRQVNASYENLDRRFGNYDFLHNDHFNRTHKHRSRLWTMIEIDRNGSYYAGIGWRGGSRRYTGNASGLVQDLLSGVRQILARCPLEETRRCVGNGLADYTYTPRPLKPDFEEYCWNRPVSRQPSLECSMKTESASPVNTSQTALTNSSPATPVNSSQTTSRHKKEYPVSPWFIVCVIAIAIAGIAAVGVSVQQCVNYSKNRKLERQRLAECGLVCVPKRKNRFLEASMSTQSITEGKSVRSVPSVKKGGSDPVSAVRPGKKGGSAPVPAVKSVKKGGPAPVPVKKK